RLRSEHDANSIGDAAHLDDLQFHRRDDRRDVRVAYRHRPPDLELGRELPAAAAFRRRDPARCRRDRLQRDGALPRKPRERMASVASLSVVPRAPANAAIEVVRLSHTYAGREGQVPALQEISLTVGAGRFVVIVGPSGCGKTSLLMMMAGLRHQT